MNFFIISNYFLGTKLIKYIKFEGHICVIIRIPKEMLYDMPTTLLYSLEGMPELDWEKLLKLQFEDGSFFFSPSSTAFALMQTKDDNCLKYLTETVQRFNGGGN